MDTIPEGYQLIPLYELSASQLNNMDPFGKKLYLLFNHESQTVYGYNIYLNMEVWIREKFIMIFKR